MKIARSSLAASAVAAALLLTSCTTGATPDGGTASGQSTDTIRTALNSDPTTFNAAKANAKDDYEVARFLFDTVIRRDADGKFIGGLATGWKATPTEATLTIRDGATCSDGTPITPSIVADSLNYFADPATKNNFGKLVFGPGQPTITADDAGGTVSIELAQPWGELVGGLTLAQAGIICPAGLADLDGLAKGSVAAAFSGPYTLTKASHGVSYEMTLRSDYDAWPKYATPLEGVPAKTVRFFPGVNKTTVANQLLTGEMDVSDIAPADTQRFENNDDYAVSSVPFAGIFILFNQRPGSPFTDPALRKAVAQVVNQQAFNAAAYSGKGIAYNSIVAPTVSCALPDNSQLTKEDLAAAKAVLDGKTFKMVGTTSIGPNGAGSTYLQEALRAAGATLDLKLVDNGAWATMTQTQPETWDLTIQGDANFIGTVAASLTRIAGVPTEEGGRNIGGGENAEVLADISTAQNAGTEAERCAAYTKAQTAVLEDNDIVPLVGEPQIVVQRAGFSIQAPSGIVDYGTLRITK